MREWFLSFCVFTLYFSILIIGIGLCVTLTSSRVDILVINKSVIYEKCQVVSKNQYCIQAFPVVELLIP